jgi:hypothetical protein
MIGRWSRRVPTPSFLPRRPNCPSSSRSCSTGISRRSTAIWSGASDAKEQGRQDSLSRRRLERARRGAPGGLSELHGRTGTGTPHSRTPEPHRERGADFFVIARLVWTFRRGLYYGAGCAQGGGRSRTQRAYTAFGCPATGRVPQSSRVSSGLRIACLPPPVRSRRASVVSAAAIRNRLKATRAARAVISFGGYRVWRGKHPTVRSTPEAVNHA